MIGRKRIQNKLTNDFYEKILNTAIHQAGPRYTPGVERGAPNLQIEELIFAFECLGRTQEFLKYLTNLHNALKKSWHRDFLISQIPTFHLKNGNRLLGKLESEIADLFSSFSLIIKCDDLQRKLDFINLHIIANKCIDTIEKLEMAFYKKKEDYRKGEGKSEEESTNHILYELRKLREVIYEINSFASSLNAKLVNMPTLLLLGEAGIGKTHFLCDIAKKRIKIDLPTLILLGHQFQTINNPLQQIIKILELKLSKKDFLKKLNDQGLKKKSRAIIILDAINEGDKEGWKRNLNRLLKELESYPDIGIVLSCRVPFEKIIIPKRLRSKLVSIYHPGFRNIEVDAQSEFFKFYKIPLPEVPLLIPEFSNPLFLKLFCKALEKISIGQKHKQIKEIAAGQKGMTYIFEAFIKNRGQGVEEEFNLNSGQCWEIIKEVAKNMAENKRDWILKEEMTQILGEKSSKKRLINKFIIEGMLNESIEWNSEKGKYAEIITFPYQKFSDHIIARYLLNKYLNTSTKEAIKKSFAPGSYFSSLIKDDYTIYDNSGLIEAIMIEFPIRTKNKGEIFDFLKMKKIPGILLEAFTNGLFWRDPTSFNKSTDKMVSLIINHDEYRNDILDVLVALATKPKHPYNAERLNRFLEKFKMSDRDLFWSEFLRRQNVHNSIYRILNWVEKTKGNDIPRDYVEMYLIILMWVLTSTDRALRDRATRCIYFLGRNFPERFYYLSLKSLSINDPYVPERMLTASYGVAMALHNNLGKPEFRKNFLPQFVTRLYKLMFRKGAPYSTTHILMRDYARYTIEIALLHNRNLLKAQQKKRIRPPFKDGGIRRWGKEKDRNEHEYREGNYPFGTDFDNYTVGRLLPNRQNYDFKNPEYIKVKSNMWWRIYSLGYSLDKFGDIDKEIAGYSFYRFGRAVNEGKVDKYGKKYCWIAFYEIAGYRKDKGLLEGRLTKLGERFSDTDIDPSFPEKPQEVKIIEKDYLKGDPKDLAKWIEKGPTPDVSVYLILTKINNMVGPWVLLDGAISQKNYKIKRSVFIFPRGFLIKEKNIGIFNKYKNKVVTTNRALPEIEEDHYIFAGEIPWCDTFPYTREPAKIEIPISRKIIEIPKKETKLVYKKNGKQIILKDYEKLLKYNRTKDEKQMLKLIREREIEILQLRKIEKKEVVNNLAIDVQIPVREFCWEQYHSITNPGQHAYVPSKELANDLSLHIEPQSFDMLDKKGGKASITLQWGDPLDTSHELIYLRKDLLDKYLTKKDKQLVWIIWGERGYRSEDNKGLEEFRKKHKPYQVYQYILRYSRKKKIVT
ncbi:MAG: hypothetical protein HWN66_16750 [Candidatus Helarchaeota archaeon]|nr:hypothetical protein [Candidatus Helarchaeota archaeon]